MENQPPVTNGRQWFRLASLARLEALGQAPAPAPAPAPASNNTVPRVPIPRPLSDPAQPQATTRPANEASLPTGPTVPAVNQVMRQPTPPPSPRPPAPPTLAQTVRQPTPLATVSPQAMQKATPPQSPRPARALSQNPTPPDSPKVINQSSPTPPESPSIPRQLKPIKAPPPYPEPEQKPLRELAAASPTSKFMQQGGNSNGNGNVKTIADINGKPPSVNINENHNHHHADARGSPLSPKRETGNHGTGMGTTWTKKESVGETKVITMAGENTGAYMELRSAHSRHSTNRKQQHRYMLNQGSESQSEDGKSDNKKKDKGKKAETEGKPMTALVNSNVQSINNSIIFRSSCAHQSPGVHMTIVSRRQPKKKATNL